MSVFYKLACNVALVLVPMLAWGECTTVRAEDGEPKWEVYARDNAYLGYVVQGRSGSWFAWRDGKGTTDRELQTHDEAVEWVCRKLRDVDASEQRSTEGIATSFRFSA